MERYAYICSKDALVIARESRHCKLAIYNKCVEYHEYLGVNITSNRNLERRDTSVNDQCNYDV
jgi:hypothetical protein